METQLMYLVVILLITQSITLLALLLMYRRINQSNKQTEASERLSLNDIIPSVRAFSLGRNKTVDIKKLIKKPSLIVFVTPHSRACHQLLHECRSSYEENEGQFEIITVILGGEPEVRKLLTELDVPGEHLWDPTKEVFHHFGIQMAPYAFSVNRHGVVIDKGDCGTKDQINLLTAPL